MRAGVVFLITYMIIVALWFCLIYTKYGLDLLTIATSGLFTLVVLFGYASYFHERGRSAAILIFIAILVGLSPLIENIYYRNNPPLSTTYLYYWVSFLIIDIPFLLIIPLLYLAFFRKSSAVDFRDCRWPNDIPPFGGFVIYSSFFLFVLLIFWTYAFGALPLIPTLPGFILIVLSSRLFMQRIDSSTRFFFSVLGILITLIQYPLLIETILQNEIPSYLTSKADGSVLLLYAKATTPIVWTLWMLPEYFFFESRSKTEKFVWLATTFVIISVVILGAWAESALSDRLAVEFTFS